MAEGRNENRELVLNPGEYAFLQDLTRGVIKTHVGPTVVNQTGQEQPVRYNWMEEKFERCVLEGSVQTSPVAKEGDYVVLDNPAADGQYPEDGGVSNTPEIRHGCKVNLPGPITFALFPRQKATVVKGHHLRSNQYLMVRIYNEDEARKNWSDAVVKTNPANPQAPGAGGDPNSGGDIDANVGPAEGLSSGQEPGDLGAGNEGQGSVESGNGGAVVASSVSGLDLTIGRRYVIKGTEVSFYIPPTGVEVLPGDGGSYVREAVTLERLEYAILTDEDGNKRYERGPKVVFPRPTEDFVTEGGTRKFRAIELNGLQGLHVKVTAPYEEDGKKYTEGEEIFITGDDCAIYYPRPEHSIIRYGGRKKSYAVAVPSGEGRYVLDRKTSMIETVKGPNMLLPNPVTHVLVRRCLSERQCRLWYPGNSEAARYNDDLRRVQQTSDGTSLGGAGSSYVEDARYSQSRGGERMDFAAADEAADAGMGDVMDRGTKFTKPRELFLDTKYDGCPIISPWTGYAVMVVNKTGDRRVVVGPESILLDYDETLEVLSLSTGKPKNTDDLQETVYLRVRNNKVSDIIEDVTTHDDVPISIKVSFRVNFVTERDGEEFDPACWFEVENYVKLLCDQVRSMLKGAVRRMEVEAFYNNAVDIVRDLVLGEKPEDGSPRPGLFFHENAMHVVDVDVLRVKIENPDIERLMRDAQLRAVTSNINLNEAERALNVAKREQKIDQERMRAEAETAEVRGEIRTEEIDRQLSIAVADFGAQLKKSQEEYTVAQHQEEIEDLRNNSEIGRIKARSIQKIEAERALQEVRLESLKAESDAVIARFGAAQDGFSEAMLALSNQETLQKVAEALSVQRMIGGDNAVDAIRKMFVGSPLEPIIEGMEDKIKCGSGIPAEME